MEKIKNPFRNVQVVYHRSKPLTKVVVIAAIALSIAALITLRWAQLDIQAQTQDMRQEAAQLEQENAQLEDKINDLGSVQSVMDIAQEELGLVNPDTVIIVPGETPGEE